MRKRSLKVVVFGMLALPALAGFAQPNDKDKVVAKLEVNKGVVMTSVGGEFATADTGQELIKDERLMVTKDSSATVVYNDHCRRTYSDPGVYKIDADCKVVAWWGGDAAKTAAIIGGVVVAGVVVGNNNNDNNPPISR